MNNNDNIVKTEFDFIGLTKKPKRYPEYIRWVFQYRKGDILDVGCATCQLYDYLREQGWKGKYYGVDSKKYENYEYSQNVNLIIGNTLEIEFPKVDTVVLYNILEHVDKPITLLRKAINAAKENVLINVPKRNEEMWKYGIVEYHQLDKTHKHCGFSKDEVYRLVDLAGGKIREWKKWDGITVIPIKLLGKHIGKLLLNPRIGRRIFPNKTFYTEI